MVSHTLALSLKLFSLHLFVLMSWPGVSCVKPNCCCFYLHSPLITFITPCSGWTILMKWRQLLLPGLPPLQPVPLAAVKFVYPPQGAPAVFPPRTAVTPVCWSGFWRSPNWWWWRSPRTEAWGFGMSVKDAQPVASWVCPAPRPTRLSLR